MISAKLLVFSRSIINDYRWIFFDKNIGQADQNLILSDYRVMERNSEFYLNEQHLIVRYLKQGISMYKYLETEIKDQNSRRIYALIGCVFSGWDYDFIKSILQYIVSYLFINSNLFNQYQNNILDNIENGSMPIEFDLNTIVKSQKNNYEMNLLINNVNKFIHQNPNNNFIITNKDIKSIITETESVESVSQCGKIIDGLVSNTNNSNIAITKQYKKNKKKFRLFNIIRLIFKKS